MGVLERRIKRLTGCHRCKYYELDKHHESRVVMNRLLGKKGGRYPYGYCLKKKKLLWKDESYVGCQIWKIL